MSSAGREAVSSPVPSGAVGTGEVSVMVSSDSSELLRRGRHAVGGEPAHDHEGHRSHDHGHAAAERGVRPAEWSGGSRAHRTVCISSGLTGT